MPPLANADNGGRTGTETAMLDYRSSLVLQESLTTAASKPQSIDGGEWITNHLPTQPFPQAASDTPQDIHNELMSIDDEHSAGDTVTAASSPAESDANEFGDWLGVPLNLVLDGADLSKL